MRKWLLMMAVGVGILGGANSEGKAYHNCSQCNSAVTNGRLKEAWGLLGGREARMANEYIFDCLKCQANEEAINQTFLQALNNLMPGDSRKAGIVCSMVERLEQEWDMPLYLKRRCLTSSMAAPTQGDQMQLAELFASE